MEPSGTGMSLIESRAMIAQRTRLAAQMERLLQTMPPDLRVGLP